MNVSSLDLSFKLETFIVVILHYSYFYLHFCKCQYLKSKHISKECIFKFAEIKKKVQKCMNNEGKCIKIAIMKVSSLKPWYLFALFTKLQNCTDAKTIWNIKANDVCK